MTKVFIVLSLVQFVSGFVPKPLLPSSAQGGIIWSSQQKQQPQHGTKLFETVDAFEVTVAMPPTGSNLQANLKIQPVLSVPSEIVEVRYKIPFGLNVEPKKGLAICTKDGDGGEKVGDVLRYTSRWSIGLPSGSGLVSQAAAFSGGVSWQCTMFNIMKAESWEEVVGALTSNVESRTDEVVLIFERPLEPAQ